MKRRAFIAAGPLAVLAARSEAQSPLASQQDIVLGQTADLSASRAAITKAYAGGAALHFNHVNAAGGIAGRRIRLVQLDDGYSADKAAENAKRLVEEHGVFALVQAVGTGITERLLPYVDDAGVPLLHPLTGADHIRPPQRLSPNTFFLRASYQREVERILGQLHTLGISRVALVHEDEPFGRSVRDAVVRTMKDLGGSAAAIGVLPFNKPDEVAQAVAVVSKANPAAVIVGSGGPSVERFIQAYHRSGARTQYYCLSVGSAERLHQALGPLSEGIVLTQVMPAVQTSNLPVVRNYRDRAAAAGVAPSAFGLEGYISARLVVQALENAGPRLTRARFLASLEEPAASQIGGFPVRYRSEPREGSPFVELAMIGPQGKLVR